MNTPVEGILTQYRHFTFYILQNKEFLVLDKNTTDLKLIRNIAITVHVHELIYLSNHVMKLKDSQTRQT